MLTIGQANVYFTLWEVSEPFKEYTSATSFYWKVDYWYRQNLSMNLEAAIAKLEGGEYKIDLELRGSKSYSVFDRNQLHNDASDTQFSFGKFEGREILTCDDIFQLGHFVKYKHKIQINNNWNEIDGRTFDIVNRTYTTPKQAAILEAKKLKEQTMDHYFNDGDKVVLKLKEIERFGFYQTFGYREQYTSIVTYLDEQGRGFKYMGSNPPSFIGADEFVAVKGTVCHDEYRGVKETKLKRISITK